MLVSNKGQMIRINVGEISEQGRNTQGVRLMTVSPGEKVVSIESMAESVTENEGASAPSNGHGNNGAGSGNGAAEGDGEPTA